MEKTRSVANVLDKSSVNDSDGLYHLFCGNCRKQARAHGWKEKAFCGVEGFPNSNGSAPSSVREQCMVCDEMATRNCVKCGYRPVVIR